MSNTSTGSVRAKKKLIPKLRFPEFVMDGVWVANIVSQVAEYENGKAHEQDIVELGKYVVVNSKFISTAGEVRKFSNSANCLAKKNEILMVLSDVPNGRAIAKCFYVDKDDFYTVNQRICKLTPVNADGKLLLYLLNRNQFFLAFDDGVKQTNLRNEDVLNCPIILPKNPNEQQKIASCLSSLDEVIAAHSQKLDALKTHKKGLMQNLFPQEGETVPKYRFPEFRDKGAWVLQKLEGLAKRGSGHTPNKQMSNYYNGGIKWVSLADSNKLDNGYIYATKIQISKDGIENSSAVLHPAGAVILSRDAGVGKSALLYSEMAVSQHFIAWVCDESKLSNWFLYYVLQILKPAFESIAVGSTIKTIGLPYFKELCIHVPSIKEQQKIASCLSWLDTIITAQADKIDQLKLHKKGLMQGLFPKIND